MAKSVRIWQRKQLRLDRLTFRQRDMVEIGAAGLYAQSPQGANAGMSGSLARAGETGKKATRAIQPSVRLRRACSGRGLRSLHHGDKPNVKEPLHDQASVCPLAV